MVFYFCYTFPFSHFPFFPFFRFFPVFPVSHLTVAFLTFLTLGFDLGIPDILDIPHIPEIFDLGIFAHFFLVVVSAHFGPIPPSPILLKTIGTGYLQSKRNAYKISSGGQYGNLIIDVPKLMGQLHLVAKKDGNKVLDKKVDFDTLDLLTKRFNSKKKYSDLSKMIFNELNKLSEIPIHRSSKKYSKIGSGIIYYNDVNDLIDRMELLGGSIMAGNDGAKSEFSEIVHKLFQLGKIDNGKLNDLLKVYVI